jgi:tetratricopeptide (TPR) repeat protein
LELNRNLLGDSSLDYASSLTSVGNLYKEMGNYLLAENCYQKSLIIKFNASGGKTKDYALGLNNLGYLYSEMGKYDTSLFLIQQSINISFDLNIDSAEMIEKFHSLATIYFKMGKYTEAQKYFNIAIGYLTLSSPLTKELLYKYDLAENFIAQAKYDQALIILNHLDSLSNGLDLDRVKGDIYYSIGKIHSKKGNYKQAKEYYSKALNLRENVIPGHADLAVSLNSIAVIYFKLGAYNEVETYYKKALDIRKKALGELHPEYAMSLNNLGVLYKQMGDYQTAELFHKQALEIRKKALGEEHPDYAKSLSNLGVLYKEIGDYNAAESYYKAALEIQQSTLKSDHPDYASTLNNIGILYLQKIGRRHIFLSLFAG